MPGRLVEFRAWFGATLDELVRSAYRVCGPLWGEAAAVGSRAWVEGLASRIVVGRKAVVPVAAPMEADVGEGEGTYALPASRWALKPLRDGVD